MNKTDRRRKAGRERMRRHRANKAWQEAERQALADAQAKAIAEQQERARATARLCTVCQSPNTSASVDGVLYCAEHGQKAADRISPPAPSDLPTLPPIRRPDPMLFDPASDPWRPAFWQEIDPNPQPIRLPQSPIIALMSPPFSGQAVTYSVAEGHRDRAAEAAAERLKRERSGR